MSDFKFEIGHEVLNTYRCYKKMSVVSRFIVGGVNRYLLANDDDFHVIDEYLLSKCRVADKYKVGDLYKAGDFYLIVVDDEQMARIGGVGGYGHAHISYYENNCPDMKRVSNMSDSVAWSMLGSAIKS